MTNFVKGCLGCLGIICILALLIGGCTAIFQDDSTETDKELSRENSSKQNQPDRADQPEEEPAPSPDSPEPEQEEEEPESSPSNDRMTATVASITDGDTIKVNMNGREETIRFILVDTPETKHPRIGVQPFGPEASAFTEQQLSGKEVQIEPGIEERDRYGRLLAYIYVDGQMFNKRLLKEGLARVDVYPPNTKYLDEFQEIQSAAQQKQIGIWSIENYVTEDGYNTEQAEETPKQEADTASDPTPAPASPAESYKNCTELRSVYPDGVPADHPAYNSKHDRDNDRWACES